MACILLSISSFAPPATPRTLPHHPYMQVRWRRRIVPVPYTEVRSPTASPQGLACLTLSPYLPCPRAPTSTSSDSRAVSSLVSETVSLLTSMSVQLLFCMRCLEIASSPHSMYVSFKAIPSTTLAGPPWLWTGCSRFHDRVPVCIIFITSFVHPTTVCRVSTVQLACGLQGSGEEWVKSSGAGLSESPGTGA